MPRLKDLTGKTFGQLTVVGMLPNRSRHGKVLWRCRCSCGGWAPSVVGGSLASGLTKSCGCEQRRITSEVKTTHGLSNRSGNAHNRRWQGIKQRTGNPKNRAYPRYGGRGISMFKSWSDSFVEFKAWLDENLGPCPEGFSLDRIDNDGNYEPDNLRWASQDEQNKNRR